MKAVGWRRCYGIPFVCIALQRPGELGESVVYALLEGHGRCGAAGWDAQG